VLARFAGATAVERAGLLDGAEVVEDDEPLWVAQREGQRSADGIVVRVSALPTELPAVLRAADNAGASVVARAGVGVSYLALPATGGAEAIGRLRAELSPAAAVVLDAPAELRGAIDPWGVEGGGELALARRVKERFDPQRICNPGLFLGGI
jgi:glycolate oxidase FAD binding subunit